MRTTHKPNKLERAPAVCGEGSAAKSVLQAEEDKIKLRLENLCHSGLNDSQASEKREEGKIFALVIFPALSPHRPNHDKKNQKIRCTNVRLV